MPLLIGTLPLGFLCLSRLLSARLGFLQGKQTAVTRCGFSGSPLRANLFVLPGNQLCLLGFSCSSDFGRPLHGSCLFRLLCLLGNQPCFFSSTVGKQLLSCGLLSGSGWFIVLPS